MDINHKNARPSSLRHLVGMTAIKMQVQTAIDASFADGEKFPNTLLVSEPGLGKSELVSVLAQEMAVKLHHVLGMSIRHVSDLNGLLLGANDKDIVYFNEADSLKPDFQVALYMAIDRGAIVLSGGKSGKAPQSIPLPDITIILDSNYEFSILPALRDRMKQTLYLPFYDEDELAEIVGIRGRALKWNLDDSLPAYLASLARGTPRQVLRLLASAHRVSRSEGATTVTLAHAKRSMQMEGIDSKGLTTQEQAYLRALAEGASRLGIIASRIAMPSHTVQQVVEPYLLRSGLISKDDGRRELTREGREHVAHLSSKA